ncbi:hypothetical protein FZC79_17780 [Rossellomorea vietnamensis]|uniref:Uncharacterized protein n=1 Tax=Rossellomorea vietnamensis TaxID=218284 RepID=A0A5D4KAF9_9BACI|nr:hypothetical protein [Rossellomorea vietnamensis]TYR73725.1 hypothetical protein FZC79_17780 [Rossellomorea vietnamensis]
MNNIKKEIRESFDGLSRDEILAKLLNAGFNVKKGSGKITVKEDNLNEEMHFQLKSKYTLKPEIGSGKAEEYIPQINYSLAS